MTFGATSSRIVVADVKCYHCGHVSGQIAGRRHQPLRVSDFMPRPGYSGPEVKPGSRLRTLPGAGIHGGRHERHAARKPSQGGA